MEPNLNKDNQQAVKSLAPRHCDLCGNKYTESDFNVMRSTPQQTVIHLHCKSCGNSYMLNVFSPVNGFLGSSRAPINLDLTTAKELTMFAGRKPIAVDEALDAYNAIYKSDALTQFISNSSKV